MSLLSLVLFCFIGVRLLVAFSNWLARSYLPRQNLVDGVSDISVLIPARNEETNIERLLRKLTHFETRPKEIIIYDDNSSDATARVVSSFAKTHDHIKLIHGAELPSDWLGKNHACHNLAQHANGQFLLFLDADVHIGEDLFSRSITFVEKSGVDLLSIFPQQIMRGLGEKISVPLMNWILLSLLPLPLVRFSKNPAFAAANGQFMMFRAHIYKKMWPHEKFKLHKVEDIAINRFYKESGLKTATLLGDDDMQCRMYAGLNESILGFSKNVFQFFGNSKMTTVAFGLLTTLAPFLVWRQSNFATVLVYLAAMLLIRLFVSLASRQNIIQNFIVLVPQHVIFLIIIFKALTAHRKKELLWKDRNILQ